MLSRDKPLYDLRHGQPGEARQVNDFGRRERVQAKCRVALLDGAEQILVPLNRQVGVVAALQQQLVAADRDRLVDLAEDLLEAEDVAVRGPDRAIERAEVAAGDADIRVVDVTVDDVAHDTLGMLAAADRVGHAPEPIGRRRAIKQQRFVS